MNDGDPESFGCGFITAVILMGVWWLSVVYFGFFLEWLAK